MDVNKPTLAFNLKTFVALYRGLVAFLGMFINGFIGWILLKITFGRSADFNYRFISSFFCKLILKLLGMKVTFPKREDFPKEKMLYIFNHNSYLDIFIIPAMRIPRCRYIISEITKSILPLYLSNLANGAIFIPHPKKEEKRKVFFLDGAKRLQLDDYSLFASPEGVHTFVHGISNFNLGIFRMAMEAGVSICPLFFNMNKENNPLESYFFKPGEIKIEKMNIIDTSLWSEDNLELKVKEVEEMYKQKFESVHGREE
jgi:1-acyl-sn-glycerol-3-phosphate acyltransferase